MLHQHQPQHYRVTVGKKVKIKLPQLPLTADAEFLQLTIKSYGSDCVKEQCAIDEGEGYLIPQEVTGIATKAGSKHYVIQVVNALSQEKIKNIDNLDIILDVEEVGC